jgi:hypothetical protein
MNINWKKIPGKIGLWFIELVTVFIGVYLAFLLNGHRIQQNHEHKRQQIYTALYHYFSTIYQGYKSGKTGEASIYKPFLKAYKKKEMPRLLREPFITTASINDHGWNAMLEAGGVDLLDVKLILQVNGFFNEVRIEKQATQHFNRMNDKYIRPYPNAPKSKFYNIKTKQIKPEYEWYISYIKKDLSVEYSQFIVSKDILEALKQKMNKKQLQKITADSAG